jgi:hypothetical protein
LSLLSSFSSMHFLRLSIQLSWPTFLIRRYCLSSILPPCSWCNLSYRSGMLQRRDLRCWCRSCCRRWN